MEEMKFKSILMLSADTPEQLRAIDVYRVMEEANNLNCLKEFTEWLKTQAVTGKTRNEIDECFKELEAEKASAATPA